MYKKSKTLNILFEIDHVYSVKTCFLRDRSYIMSYCLLVFLGGHLKDLNVKVKFEPEANKKESF